MLLSEPCQEDVWSALRGQRHRGSLGVCLQEGLC